MKYAVIDQTSGDWFEDVFDSEEKAIARADYEWGIMTNSDKAKRVEYYVASCDLTEDGCVDFDTVAVIKVYK